MSATIRPGTAADLKELGIVEEEADTLFTGHDYLFQSTKNFDQEGHRTLAAGTVFDALNSNALFVAEVDGVMAGFIVMRALETYAWVEQISVRPAYSRQGIGRSLMQRGERWATDNDFHVTALSTFRDITWNELYYRKLGYTEMPKRLVTKEILEIRAREVGHALLGDHRIFMFRDARH